MMNTCRFCGEQHNSMVRYGKRHYACWPCYLDAGKPLSDLVTVELRQIPWRLVRDRGLEAEVAGILAFREQRRAAWHQRREIARGRADHAP